MCLKYSMTRMFPPESLQDLVKKNLRVLYSPCLCLEAGVDDPDGIQICIGKAVEVSAAKSRYAVDALCDAIEHALVNVSIEFAMGRRNKASAADKRTGFHMFTDDFDTVVEMVQMAVEHEKECACHRSTNDRNE